MVGDGVIILCVTEGKKGPANYTMMSYFLGISAITGTYRHFSEVEMGKYRCCEINKM